MCDKAVRDYLFSLRFVPDWFVTEQQIDIWYDDDDYCNDDKIIRWYEGYKRRRAQKAQNKKELMPVTWHPSRYWDWCMRKDGKRDIKALWA